jgi:hypothetical protein
MTIRSGSLAAYFSARKAGSLRCINRRIKVVVGFHGEKRNVIKKEIP